MQAKAPKLLCFACVSWT